LSIAPFLLCAFAWKNSKQILTVSRQTNLFEDFSFFYHPQFHSFLLRLGSFAPLSEKKDFLCAFA
jgi:hypothetical protein